MNYLNINQTIEQYPLTKGTLRKLLQLRKRNGLDSAIIKVNRKILIHREKFEEWLNYHLEMKQPESSEVRK